MAAEKIHLRILTAESEKANEEADMVIMRCINGDIGFLPNHEPYSVVLDTGVTRILRNGSERKIAVFGGLAEIQDNKLTILTTTAQWPEDIDLASVKEECGAARQSLRESSGDEERQKNQALLRRALVQIEVGEHRPEPEDNQQA